MSKSSIVCCGQPRRAKDNMTDCSLLLSRGEAENRDRKTLRLQHEEFVPEPEAANAGAAAVTIEDRPRVSDSGPLMSELEQQPNVSYDLEGLHAVQQPPPDVSDTSTTSTSNVDESIATNGHGEVVGVKQQHDPNKEQDNDTSKRVVSPDADSSEPDAGTNKSERQKSLLEGPSSKKIKLPGETVAITATQNDAAETVSEATESIMLEIPPQEMQTEDSQPSSVRKEADADASCMQSTSPKNKEPSVSFSGPEQLEQEIPQLPSQPNGEKPTPGLKAPPAYALTPQLLEQAKSRLNKSLQPDQMSSLRMLQQFGKRQRERRERMKQQKQKSKETKQKKHRLHLSPTRFQARGQFFHHTKEAFAQQGLNYLRNRKPMFQEKDLLPAIQMLMNGGTTFSSSHDVYNHLTSHIESNSSICQRTHGAPSFPSSCMTPPATPPTQRNRYEQRKTGDEIPHLPMLQYDVDETPAEDGVEELPVSVEDLTLHGNGREWTCVFSVAGRWELGYDPEVALDKHFNRLIGYRMHFDGANQGVDRDISGENGRILPPKDEGTRAMTAQTSNMMGTLHRRNDAVTCHPDGDFEPVVCYGWRPDDGSLEAFGLEDYWSDWMSSLNKRQQKDHFVDVTIEAATASLEYNWKESFPFGDLFGENEKLASRVPRAELEDRYWKYGIIVLFHWKYEVSDDHSESGHKEFAYFVPSDQLLQGDDAFDTSTVQLNDDDGDSTSSEQY